MKNIFLGALLLLSTLVFSQDKLKILYQKDAMTDNEYVYISDNLLCSIDGKVGFSISPRFKIDKDKTIKYNGIVVKSNGVGSCMENDELIILFEDSTKLTLKSWNKFNCEGNSYFDFQKSSLKDINKKIKAIRLMNGRSYESFTYTLKNENEKNYFIYATDLLNGQKYEIDSDKN